MFHDYRVTVDEDPTPDWLTFLEISLFLIALPIGVLYLIIKGIVKIVQISKEKKAKKELEKVNAELRREQLLEAKEQQRRNSRQDIVDELSQISSLVKSGIVKTHEVEKRRKELVEMLNSIPSQGQDAGNLLP